MTWTESNIVPSHGLSLYRNGSMSAAKYQTGGGYPHGGLWVADTPKNTEAAGLTWQPKNWDVGIFNKRAGQMYNHNGTLNYVINGIPVPATAAIAYAPKR